MNLFGQAEIEPSESSQNWTVVGESRVSGALSPIHKEAV